MPRPLYDQKCSNCNASRLAATQCRLKPLQSIFAGMGQRAVGTPLLANANGAAMVHAEPIFVPACAPAAPDYWCTEWREMEETHPDHPAMQRTVPREVPQIIHPWPEKAQ